MGLTTLANGLLKDGVASGAVPCVAALVSTPGGSVYKGAFGERAAGSGVAMTTDTVGWFASCTKALTSAAALKLVYEGKLGLDEPVGKWVPEIGAVQVIEGYGSDGQPKLRPPKMPVTLRHLLTHTSGYVYEMWNMDILRYQEFAGVPGLGLGFRAALTTPIAFDPGARWEYGTGIDVAGLVVEAASGQTLGAYLSETFFKPLGMTSSAFAPTADMEKRLAKLHHRMEDGSIVAGDMRIGKGTDYEAGGGGLYSTAEDYLKFLMMVLNGGKAGGSEVLPPEVIAMMSQNQIGDLKVTKLQGGLMEALARDAEFFPGLTKRWSLAFMLNEDEAPTGRSAGSMAWAGLPNIYYWIDPVKKFAAIFFTQLLPFFDREAVSLFTDFENAVYDEIG